MKTILVTGGAGYIGSHTCVELLAAGYAVVVVDNLCNASEEALRRVRKISGKPLEFQRVDVRNKEALSAVFDEHPIDAVVHFAGLKSVAESVEDPARYFENNLGGTVTLCEVMAAHGIKSIVFSSTAAVYGEPSEEPIPEEAPTHPAQPYGESKLAVERHLHSLVEDDPAWNALSLRYFNPVGAHDSGLIGEDPTDIPHNLAPYITQVAIGKLEVLSVWGDDWPTPDGTGVRDYIHVVDLARAHEHAIELLASNPGELVLNLGTGRPYSVLEVHAAFERAVGQTIPYEIKGRREGDSAMYFADPRKANSMLGWEATRDIDAMARDAWRWQKMNPDGYK